MGMGPAQLGVSASSPSHSIRADLAWSFTHSLVSWRLAHIPPDKVTLSERWHLSWRSSTPSGCPSVCGRTLCGLFLYLCSLSKHRKIFLTLENRRRD